MLMPFARPKPGRWRSFLRADSGTTVIEFAILAPLFFAIVAAILETSLVFMSGQMLESAVQDSGRLIRTGQIQRDNTTLAQFRSGMCDRLYGMFADCDDIHLRVSVISNFASATVSAPLDPTCEEAPCEWNTPQEWTPGIGSSIVLVQAYYQRRMLLDIGSFSLSNLPGGYRLLGAATVFRNEPFAL